RPFYRPIMHGERNCITLPQWHHLHAALHTWSLFCQNELTTGEILSRFGEKNRNLERKGKIAVKVLVQAIEVARDILQQQRCGSRLAAVGTPSGNQRAAPDIVDRYSCERSIH